MEVHDYVNVLKHEVDLSFFDWNTKDLLEIMKTFKTVRFVPANIYFS